MLPSPKFQAQDVGRFEDSSTKVTLWPMAGAEVAKVKAAMGAMAGAAVTAKVWLAGVAVPDGRVTARVTW